MFPTFLFQCLLSSRVLYPENELNICIIGIEWFANTAWWPSMYHSTSHSFKRKDLPNVLPLSTQVQPFSSKRSIRSLKRLSFLLRASNFEVTSLFEKELPGFSWAHQMHFSLLSSKSTRQALRSGTVASQWTQTGSIFHPVAGTYQQCWTFHPLT